MIKVIFIFTILFFASACSHASILVPMYCQKYSGELFSDIYSKKDFPVVEKCIFAEEFMYRFRSIPEKNRYGFCRAYAVYIYSTGEVEEAILLSRTKYTKSCKAEYNKYISFKKDNGEQEKIYHDIWLALNDASDMRVFSLNRFSFWDRLFSPALNSFLRAIGTCKANLDCVELSSVYQKIDLWSATVSVGGEAWVVLLGYDGDKMRIYEVSSLS
ncbi:hypothetical protein [Microbulbifer sp. SSSA005]|uniref:hypothetical protein n=1 Tax=Microbulbifer sp. SSSA005 TaxID=3243378 RepID=UPI0040397737